MAEGADAHELLRFIVTFGMSWKMWTDLTQVIAWFETDDVMQRVEFLFFIACLLGCAPRSSPRDNLPPVDPC